MYKKFEINQTKIKGGYQSGRKVVTHNSKSDLPLERGVVDDDDGEKMYLKCAASRSRPFFPSTQSMNHRRNAPRRCKIFFFLPCIMMNLFERSGAPS